MKKPFYWVKTAICNITGGECVGHENIPMGVKGMSPDCSNCVDYQQWNEAKREAIIRQAFESTEAAHEAELQNREINKAGIL